MNPHGRIPPLHSAGPGPRARLPIPAAVAGLRKKTLLLRPARDAASPDVAAPAVPRKGAT